VNGTLCCAKTPSGVKKREIFCQSAGNRSSRSEIIIGEDSTVTHFAFVIIEILSLMIDYLECPIRDQRLSQWLINERIIKITILQ
jgi:hypothetical protein